MSLPPVHGAAGWPRRETSIALQTGLGGHGPKNWSKASEVLGQLVTLDERLAEAASHEGLRVLGVA